MKRKTTCLDVREGGEPIVLCKLENGRLVDDKLMLLALDFRGIDRGVQVCSKGVYAFTLDRLRNNGLYEVYYAAEKLMDGNLEPRNFDCVKERSILSVNSQNGYEGILFFGGKYNTLSLKQVKGRYLTNGNLRLDEELGFIQGYDFADLRRYLEVRRRFDNKVKNERRARRAA